jgi:hypothetical protein
MRTQFAALGEQRETILAASSPLRAERDALVNQNAARIRELESQYLEIETGLFEIDMERGAIARALGGRTS